MAGQGNLLFDLFDVYGDRPDDRTDVSLRHTVLGSSRQVRDHPTSKRLRIPDLDSSQGGTYSVQILPMRHRPLSRFVRVIEDETVQQTCVLPVDPSKVPSGGVRFPAFDDLDSDLRRVLDNSTVEGKEDKRGADLYLALDDRPKAGLLNIHAKMKTTRFASGRDVFSYMASLRRIRGDRFFANVQRDLRDEVKTSMAARLFQEVSGALHTPPPLFTPADSFKTLDRTGNLQLTFFSRPDALEFIVDSDIDLAQGFGHVFEVLGDTLTGGDTDPYDVHELLVHSHKVDPGYRFVI